MTRYLYQRLAIPAAAGESRACAGSPTSPIGLAGCRQTSSRTWGPRRAPVLRVLGREQR